MRHGPRRAVLAPWRRICICGCAWYPCPDAMIVEPPAVTLSLRGRREFEHVADRPSWDCRGCGRPWPCDPARSALAVEMDRVGLAVFMWLNLEEAVLDIPRMPVPELFERFIRWTR